MGRIGSRLAQVAQAIGFTVRYCDIRDIPERERHGAECVDMPTLFAESDVISVHVDGRAGNRHLVGPDVMSMMRPDVIFLNTSRGFVVDHDALAAFMRANPAAMAMLDVHEPEPFTTAHPLLGLPNAHLAPHLASRTTTALENMSWVVRDVMTVLSGREPRWPA
jgi:D-3-phosphoglycerate dehydrogenase